MYYDKVNKELKEYFLILCDNDYPEFIEKYLNTKPLQRIGGIGQFCGCDYSKIFNVKYFYSRLDHSIACSLMAWYFTKDKSKTLMALFHDLGTPCFSHTIDYLFGDSKKQESSEKDVFDIISSSNEIMNLLEKDDITIDDLKEAYKYSMACQSGEDKYVMQFICDALKVLVENKIISLDDLYEKKEIDIVNLLRKYISSFVEFENANMVKRTEEKPDCYSVSVDAKKRYVIPLCNYNGKNYRLNEISDVAREKTNFYLNYKDSKYVYVPSIKEIKRK